MAAARDYRWLGFSYSGTPHEISSYTRTLSARQKHCIRNLRRRLEGKCDAVSGRSVLIITVSLVFLSGETQS